MTYALSFLALLAALLATVGKTWHAGRPTKTGWALIVIAIAVFAFTAMKTSEENREKERIEREKEHIEREKERIELLACQQVMRGTFNLLTPFAILVADASRMGDKDDALEERVKSYLGLDPLLDSSKMAAILDDLPRLIRERDHLTEYKVNDHPSVFSKSNNTKWRNIFLTTAVKGIGELTDALSFQSVMDSETIAATQELRNAWLTERVENLPNLRDPLSLQEFLRIGAVSNSKGDYFQEFLQAAESTIRLCSTVNTQ